MSLKQIATDLGLSLTTVSRALNGFPEVSEKTRKLVAAAAEARGYRPNSMARSLATGRMNTIGIVYPLNANDLGDPVFLDVITGLVDSLDAAGMELIISSAKPGDELPTYKRLVEGKRIDGLIVARTQVHDPRLIYLTEQKFPFVAYGRSTLDTPYAWLDFDNQAGLKLAVDRLVSLGHRRISMIGASKAFNFAAQRLAGYLEGLSTAGIDTNPDYIIEGALDRRAGYSAMMQLLAMDTPPTAVIVDNHLSGIGVMRALLDANITVGKQISLIVYDGFPADSLVGTTVTSVIQPTPNKVGQKLAEMILSRLNGENPKKLQALWQPAIEIGNSDGPCLQR